MPANSEWRRAEVNLAGLFVDYADHPEHHLRKMLGRWESEPV